LEELLDLLTWNFKTLW